jgi:hypothetical protein
MNANAIVYNTDCIGNYNKTKNVYQEHTVYTREIPLEELMWKQKAGMLRVGHLYQGPEALGLYPPELLSNFEASKSESLAGPSSTTFTPAKRVRFDMAEAKTAAEKASTNQSHGKIFWSYVYKDSKLR